MRIFLMLIGFKANRPDLGNQRKDFLHKESFKLVKRYDCIVVEDLNMKGMSQAL